MKAYLILALAVVSLLSCNKTEINSENDDNSALYFPPITGDEWSSISPQDLDWNTEKLDDLLEFLENSDSRAFIILKDGKIVVEEYWNKTLLGANFDASSSWYWASAAKTLTSFLVGQLESQGNIDLDKSTSTYLGMGWTSLTDEKERQITVRDQLAMTSGLDDSVDPYCTDSDCLQYRTDPGERWAYHNGPYTLLDGVIESASGEDFNEYFEENLKEKIGMDGFWMYQNYNHLYFSNARSMARFGLLALNDGVWDGNDLLEGSDYFSMATSSSQEINPSYGFLWWLNGENSFMLPSSQVSFSGDLIPSAPHDMYSALGKNSQIIHVVPSENLVLIRMGGDPDDSLVPLDFPRKLWDIFSQVIQK